MVEELKSIDISHSAEVRHLVAEVQVADQARALQVDHRTVAIRSPAVHSRGASRRPKATSDSDPVWDIVGLGTSNGLDDVAENIDAYLARANLPKDRSVLRPVRLVRWSTPRPTMR